MQQHEQVSVSDWLAGHPTAASTGPKAIRVRRVLVTQPGFASYATSAEVAERAEVNAATVVRYAQALGYAGWKQFQSAFRSMYSVRRFDVEAASPTSGPDGLMAEVFAQDAENLQSCLRSFDYGAALLVVNAIATARSTVVVAAGTHALPAQGLAIVAASRGYDVRLEDREEAHLAVELAKLTSDDCVVAFTFWQHYRRTVTALQLAREAGATTCAITDTLQSPAAEFADHVLVVPVEGVSNFRSMTAAMSVSYGLAASLVAVDPTRSKRALAHFDRIWGSLDLFTPDIGEE